MASAGMFRSLRNHNYRLWASGALISNVGTWMQRIAQDWLVLTQLTHQNATAVGVVMALQFGPQLLLLPLTGLAADHCNRHKLLMVTQASMGMLALGLGLLTLSGHIVLWHVYVFATLLGCASAFDGPARQTFVAELVGETDLPNAVGLNSASFNTARMIGPAVAGILISLVGTGWVFLINSASYVAMIMAIASLRQNELFSDRRKTPVRNGLMDGFRYLWERPDLKAALLMMFMISTFGLNFPIFISTMAVRVFHSGASRYGVLTTFMALGSVTGALSSARLVEPRFKHLLAGAGLFGLACLLAAIAPSQFYFGAALILAGLSAQMFNTTTNSLLQLSTAPAMRGRMLAILLAIVFGTTPVGAPVVGWVADTWGPRWALGIGGLSGVVALFIGLAYQVRHRR